MIDLLDEIKNGPLAAEIAPFYQPVMDSQAIADILNRVDRPDKKPIMTRDINQYLMLRDLLLAIRESQSESCKKAVLGLSLFESFDVRNPTVSAKLNSILDALVAEVLIPDFTESDKATILAMADTLVSRSYQIGLGVVSEYDVRVAIWNEVT